ncbi:carbonic anhydrase 2 [Fopius arisanus]|uniref:carbonic anhydrase n=1 Tax=Fopius arisanus TaxID=64838 RepID=A0A0C9RJN0_9HYME|nr:PREDICTED: carbonic anhydrase 2-like [Fopius arisanus]
MEIHVVLIGFLLSHANLVLADFTYEGLHGPQHWGKDYDECVGKHQSPINIEEHIVKNISLPKLELLELDSQRDFYIENNGHTVMLKINSTKRPSIIGGPLGSHEYVFEQLHFHWGANDHEGSEDLINNHSFAMELHVVFYKKTYKSLQEAIHHSDGLTVLAYFFEASDDDNHNYASIIDSLPDIEAVGSSTSLRNQHVMEEMLLPNPSVLQDYFTYNGSLTTPPCSEVVTWIDFKEPLRLSHNQIAAFRNVHSPDGKLLHNFRPIQPLEDRVVYHNIPLPEDNSHNADGSGQSRLHPSFPFALGAVLFTTHHGMCAYCINFLSVFR